jgi:hypothetical protein
MNTASMGNWSHSVDDGGKPIYLWSDGPTDAVLWQEREQWKLSYFPDGGEVIREHDLGPASSVENAMVLAEDAVEHLQRVNHLSALRIEPAASQWVATPRGIGGTEYQRQVTPDVHAVAWQRPDGEWMLNVKEADSILPRSHVMVDKTSVEDALGHADALIANPNYRPPQFLGYAGVEFDDQLDAFEHQENKLSAERTLEASDAHDQAKQLLDAYYRAETECEDNWPHGPSYKGQLDAFQNHLREHPELEALDKWKPHFYDLQLAERGLEPGEEIDKEPLAVYERPTSKRERNEDGMIRIPWRQDPKGPYVVQISGDHHYGTAPKYMSRDGMEEPPLGPYFDGIEKAATFERKADARQFMHGWSRDGENDVAKFKVITESKAIEQDQNLEPESLDPPSLDQSIADDEGYGY